ncbi:MAG: zinc ABC transporter substrate-binding protein [Vicingaceae bacterium]
MKKVLTLTLLIISVVACQQKKQSKSEGPIKIVCTTGMLGDAVENIVGDKASVITLMGSGVDPHLYKATQGDLKNLSNADVIVYNGLHLEGKMGEIFEKLENRKKIIVAAGGISNNELINNTDFQGAHDPHIWFDVNLWSKAVDHISRELAAFDSSSAETYAVNTKKYVAQLAEVDKYVERSILTIDSSRRVLVTAHDAFSYFGKAYNMQVKGLQGISTASEYGLKDVSNLVDFITERKIKAVFVESSVSDRSLNAVVEGCKSRGHNLRIGGTLFSDAMGENGTVEGTYIGMVKHNVKVIVEGLQ